MPHCSTTRQGGSGSCLRPKQAKVRRGPASTRPHEGGIQKGHKEERDSPGDQSAWRLVHAHPGQKPSPRSIDRDHSDQERRRDKEQLFHKTACTVQVT